MKAFLAVAAGAGLGFVAGVVAVRYDLFPFPQLRAVKHALAPNLGYTADYHSRRELFDRFGGDGHRVVFAGDSLVAEGEWQDLFPEAGVANRGIGGDRSDGLLARLEQVRRTGAGTAFLHVGINDFAAGLDADTVFTNYQRIVAQLRRWELAVVVQSTLLAGAGRRDLNPRVTDLNARLRSLAATSPGVRFVDLNASLAPQGVLEPAYTLDGIHLNTEGYAVWRERIAPLLVP